MLVFWGVGLSHLLIFLEKMFLELLLFEKSLSSGSLWDMRSNSLSRENGPASPRPGWLRNGLIRLLTMDTGMLGLDRSAAVHLTGFSVFITLLRNKYREMTGWGLVALI